MKNQTISIPELGNFAGSSAWVAEKLEKINSTFEVFNNEPQSPELLYLDPIRGNGSKTILCYMYNGSEDPDDADNYRKVKSDDGEVMVINSSDMFPYLTNKAKKIVDEYIEKVAMEFSRKINEY
jgi:hypothetical protein